MLRNYLSVAIRNLLRQRVFSMINILGLGLGLACSLLIGLWVHDELSVDAFHANGPQLYMIRSVFFFDGGKKDSSPGTPGKLYEELKKRIPEVTHASGFSWEENLTFTVGEKFNKEKGCYAGPDWFAMFSFPLLEGNSRTILQDPTSVAISRKVAEKYFGSPQAAMGKTIRVENKKDYRVSGVFEDLPEKSSLKFDFLLPWKALQEQHKWLDDWGNSGPLTFMQLRPDADPARVSAKLKHFLQQYQPKTKTQLQIQPFEEVYLYSNYDNGVQNGGRIEYVRLFSIVAVFILVIACINFMNLATARSARRAKEVGVRKVVGAERGLLIAQFLGEAMLLTFLAVLVALFVVALMLPTFNQLTDKHIVLPLTRPLFLLALLGLTLVTGFVAGSYPALFLSSLNPVRVLKGTLKFRPQARLLRQGLVVMQFVLSIMLIVGMIAVYQQLDYIQHKNLGYDRESLVYMPIEGDLKFSTFKQELLKMPGVKGVTRLNTPPVSAGGSTWGVDWPGKDPNAIISFSQNAVGYDFVPTMKIKLLDGRDFSPAFPTDSTNYIVNELAAKAMGMKNPVGQTITFWGKKGTIVGLIQDFHFESLHEPIKPLILRLQQDVPYGQAMVRSESGKTKEALLSMEKLSKQMNPKFPFTYYFSDEEYAKLYKSEQVIGKLARYFAFLGIFISCLGLLGLAAFTAEQRTKEIGIRKVLGASVPNIVTLLSKDFLKLVILANLIAWPLAWWASRQWLANFSYQTTLGWSVFVLAGLGALLIALLTVSFQAIKAALANPVKSLRTE